MTGLTLIDLATTSSPIPLTPSPDVSRTEHHVIAQTVTTPTADAPSLIQPEAAQLVDYREKLLREQREREFNLALVLRKPLPEERRPDTRPER